MVGWGGRGDGGRAVGVMDLMAVLQLCLASMAELGNGDGELTRLSCVSEREMHVRVERVSNRVPLFSPSARRHGAGSGVWRHAVASACALSATRADSNWPSGPDVDD